ncbi:MAG: EAL domain-containing protein, partial [Magnetococcales bacterium]|nr:EAL domain-containing protein [Magnetococcales bacterium]
VPAADRGSYVPIHLVEPARGNELVVGFDLLSNPSRRASLAAAMANRRLTATPPITLVQEEQQQKGVLLLVPIGRGQGGTEIDGFAVGVFKMLSLVRRTRFLIEALPFDLLIRDAAIAGGEGVLFASSNLPQPFPLIPPAGGHAKYLKSGIWLSHLDQQVSMGDRQWVIHYILNEVGFSRFTANLHAWILLGIGLLASALVQFLILAYSGRTLIVSRLVRERTAELETSRLSLARSEATMRAMLETAVSAIITIDHDRRIILFNQAAEHIFGYQANEVVGRNVNLLMPSPFREEHDGYVARYLRTGERRVVGKNHEVSGRRRNGSTFPAYLAVSEVVGESGRLFVGIITDISERREAEERLQLARRVFETAGESIVITSATGVIEDVNPAYERITGYSREEAVGQTPALTQSGVHDQAFYQQMWGALLSRGHWEGEIWDRRKNGDLFPKWLSISAIRSTNGEARHYVGIFVDISSQKETEKKLEQLAFYDPLTGLPNRMLFRDRLAQALLGSDRGGGLTGLMFIDLDRFKWVNDTLGHAAGDQLLREVSRRLQGCVRKQDTVSRLGGDEFTIILGALETPEGAAAAAAKVIAKVREAVRLNEQDVFVGASIGIAIYPRDASDLETLVKHADMAMYQAKEGGRNAFCYFSRELHVQAFDRLAMENGLRHALEHGELQLHHQPRVALATGQMLGAEALVRWNKPGQGLISPGQFIPLAEETGLILPMGMWILDQACRQNVAWHADQGVALRSSVNLSARQFQQKDLTAAVRGVLEHHALPPERLELEITESMVMGNVEEAIAIMRRLRDLGITLAIDDFGTGYSSLGYLKKFPVQILKIDQSFVRGLPADREDGAIVDAIISMAHSLGLQVVAEGVETSAQLDELQRCGCEEVQGYLLSRPLAEEGFVSLLRRVAVATQPEEVWPVRWLTPRVDSRKP